MTKRTRRSIKEAMRVRELHMREYYDEEIDEYNTAFSFPDFITFCAIK